MAPVRFTSVWFRARPATWWPFRLLAFDDIGTLDVIGDTVQFRGRKRNFALRDVSDIRCARAGRDFVNAWVIVTCADGRTAMFADGGGVGWRGVLGGTRRMANSLRTLLAS